MVFKILILDKTMIDIHRYVSMSVFPEYGFEIVGGVSNLTDAISPAAKNKFDLLMIVNREKDMSASETLRALQRKKNDKPVLIISYHESSRDMRDCFLLGALDYLVEPVSDEDIASCLKRASKTISTNIMDKTYSLAVDNAVSKLHIDNENSAMYDKLLEFLMRSKGKAVTVEEAADFFGFNPDYFRRMFKKRFGISFTDHYKQLMMDYSRLLLLTGHYKVSEVSEMLGFSSADYFTRVFKKITGQVPSDFRR